MKSLETAWVTYRRPARFISDSSPEHVACGWLFPQSVIFEPEKLLVLCNALHLARGGPGPLPPPQSNLSGSDGCQSRDRLGSVARIKGVFRTGPKQWCSLTPDEGKGCMVLEPIAYRKESRFEVIVSIASKAGQAGSDGQGGLLTGIEASKLHPKTSDGDQQDCWVSLAAQAVIEQQWDVVDQVWENIVKK
jgi:hypothetical protein